VSTSRWVALAVVLGAVSVSLFRFLTRSPSMDLFVRAALFTLVFLPLKGSLLRFLGGVRPYRSALAGNASSQLAGMGFPLISLGVPWPALAASLVFSTAFEWPALVAAGTAPAKRSLGMAAYVNFFAHLLLAGIFLCWPEVLSTGPVPEPRRPLLGAGIIFISFLVLILPIFMVSRFPTVREAVKK